MNRIVNRVVAVVLAAALGATVLLAGCGQKGPLYLPDNVHKQDQQKNKTGS